MVKNRLLTTMLTALVSMGYVTTNMSAMDSFAQKLKEPKNIALAVGAFACLAPIYHYASLIMHESGHALAGTVLLGKVQPIYIGDPQGAGFFGSSKIIDTPFFKVQKPTTLLNCLFPEGYCKREKSNNILKNIIISSAGPLVGSLFGSYIVGASYKKFIDSNNENFFSKAVYGSLVLGGSLHIGLSNYYDLIPDGRGNDGQQIIDEIKRIRL